MKKQDIKCYFESLYLDHCFFQKSSSCHWREVSEYLGRIFGILKGEQESGHPWMLWRLLQGAFVVRHSAKRTVLEGQLEGVAVFFSANLEDSMTGSSLSEIFFFPFFPLSALSISLVGFVQRFLL